MKALLNILIVIIGLQGIAQTEIPLEDKPKKENKTKTTSNFYYKDSNGVLDKFLGTWRYQSDTELYQITFTKKEKVRTGMGFYKDELNSRFKYIKNGQVIYDTYSLPVTPENNPSNDIAGGWFKNQNMNEARLAYREPGIRGGEWDTLTLTHSYNSRGGGEGNILNWLINTSLQPVPGNPEEYTTVYKVPYKMTLTKVE